MKQIDEAVQALAYTIGFWLPSWILLKKLKKATTKITTQGQYAYRKYMEIIRVGVFENRNKWRQRRADWVKT